MLCVLLLVACGSEPAATPDAKGEAEVPAPPAAAPACEGLDAEACWKVGNEAQGAGKYDAAEAAWRLNCTAGHGKSCADLANLLANPYVERGKEREAPALARTACELGSGFGCHMIGAWTLDGQNGVMPDPSAAKAFFERGCELGHRPACTEAEKP